jgi:hypothetical protein
MEYWQHIDGFDDYSISDHGRVYSHKAGKVLSPQKAPKGYLRVELWKDGVVHRRTVHGLVARHWLDTEPGETVNHKDFNKRNNHWENLEWETRVENSKHSWREGNHDHLRRVDLAVMRTMRAAGATQREIGALFGVSQPAIHYLLR